VPASGTLSQTQATHFLHEVLWAKGYRVNTLALVCAGEAIRLSMAQIVVQLELARFIE